MEKIITALANVLVALDWELTPEHIGRGVSARTAAGMVELRVAAYGIRVVFAAPSGPTLFAEHTPEGETSLQVNWPSIGSKSPAEAAAFGAELCLVSARAARVEAALRLLGEYSEADAAPAAEWLSANGAEFAVRVATARAARLVASMVSA